MSTCKLMEPIQVGSYTFKNRIVMAPMETRLCTPIGDTTPQMCDYYAERAKGGAAAIIVENTFVDSIASRSSISSSGLNSDHLIAGKYYLAQAIKENGAVEFSSFLMAVFRQMVMPFLDRNVLDLLLLLVSL